MFKIILIAAVVSAAVASGSSKNKCPWVIGKYPFDETKFVGEWQVVAGTPHLTTNLRCSKVNYYIKQENHIIELSAIKDGKAFKAESYGTPLFGKTEKAASLMSVWRKEDGTYSSVFKQAIVATDYDNYAVMIACKPVFDEKTKTFSRHLKAGIFSRKQSLSNETLEVLKNVISSYDIDPNTITAIDHTNC